MAKFKGKGVVIAGLLAGAARFLSKKENREKVQGYLNLAKEKVNESGGVQGLMQKAQSKVAGSKNFDTTTDYKEADQSAYVDETFQDVAKTAGHATDEVIDGNQMLDEGGGKTVIDEYNKEQENPDFK